MATVEATFLKCNKRADNRYPLVIRVYNNGKPGYVNTKWYVYENDFTDDGIIKDRDLRMLMDDKIKEYKDVLLKAYGLVSFAKGDEMADYLNLYELRKKRPHKEKKEEMCGWDILVHMNDLCMKMLKSKGVFEDRKSVLEHLKAELVAIEDTEEEKTRKAIDFLIEFKEVIGQMEEEKRPGKSNYLASYNHLVAFVNKEEEEKAKNKTNNPEDSSQTDPKLPIINVTTNFLYRFENYLRIEESKKGHAGKRCISLSMSCIRKVFNQCRRKYNDEDKNINIIQHYPFKNYKIKQNLNTKSRAIPAKRFKQIVEAPAVLKRETLAQDIVKLSLFLSGMTLADIYKLPADAYIDGRMSYNRGKTEEKRNDDAYITFMVPKEAKELIEKYRTTSGNELFVFSQQYSNYANFRRAVNIGLKHICEEILELPKVTSYVARYTFAKTASQLGYSHGDIALCLNQATGFKITEIYTGKPFERIDVILRDVIDYIFYKTDEEKERIVKVKKVEKKIKKICVSA